MCPKCHATLEALCVYLVPWTFALHIDVDVERLRQVLVVGEEDDSVVFPWRKSFLYGEGDDGLLFCFQCALCRRDLEPFGQSRDAVLPRPASGVQNFHLKLAFGVVVVDGFRVSSFSPADAVQVGIYSPRNRGGKAVACHIFHIAYREIKCALVDFSVLHVQVNEQFLIMTGPCEVKIGETSAVAYWGIVLLVAHIIFSFHHQRHGFVDRIPTGIFEVTLVERGEHKLGDVVLVATCLGEGEQGNQSHLVAGWRGLVKFLHKRVRQGLLKQADIVDVAFQTAAESNARTRQTAKAFGRKRLD